MFLGKSKKRQKTSKIKAFQEQFENCGNPQKSFSGKNLMFLGNFHRFWERFWEA